MLDARPETRQLLACLGRQVVVGHVSQAGAPLWGFLQTATTKRSMVAPTSGELILTVIEEGVADPRTTSSVHLQQPGVGKGAADRWWATLTACRSASSTAPCNRHGSSTALCSQACKLALQA